MRLQGVDEATARETIRRLDRTHSAYLKQFYGADIDDPSLYHLVIDSTSIPIDACVELIALATRSLIRP
jgi:cytidylate kinase